MSAQEIVESLQRLQNLHTNAVTMSREILESNLDAAQTIVLCAQHQNRIIDDVLTLSKLNSSMLHVTPVQFQVEERLRGTLKSFRSELQAAQVQLTFNVDSSYLDARINKVFCDPVRLTQIFINLMTNVRMSLVLLVFNH